MSSKHSASGASAGFAYQFHRALYWLAKSPAGSLVGVETEDDVAVRNADTSVILEQDKHSIREFATPFGDRSKDLWNTLAIWLDAVEAGEVHIASTLFLMVTNKMLPDCIARKIGSADSDEDVSSCVGALETVAVEPPQTIAKLVARVLRDTSRSTLRSLIARVALSDSGDATAAEGLRKATLAELQLPGWCLASADSVVDELLGWLHATIMSAWSQNEPAWVQRDHFVNQLHAILDRRKRQKARERAEHLIPITDETIGQEKARPFVRQLHLISSDDTLVDTSIREFIRCNIEKLRLSKEGNITDDDWTAFETTLLARWDKIRGRVARMKAGTPEEDIGYEIFTETTEDHREKLAGTETEQVYLTSGTYHRMADLLTVGWHPRYKDLMDEILRSK